MASSSWRLATVAALLLTAAPILAGCVGTASAASAMELKSPADEAAAKWSADAQLAQVVGVEGTFPLAILALVAGYDTGAAGDHEASREDKQLGDGRAEVWAYRYVSPSKENAYVVVVDAASNILRAEEDDRAGADDALDAWTVDSDKAIELALADNESLRKGLQSENFGFVSVLMQIDTPNPTWLIAGGGGSALGGGGGMVVVDAVTGEILDSRGGYGSNSG